jgi:hypothetical protein
MSRGISAMDDPEPYLPRRGEEPPSDFPLFGCLTAIGLLLAILVWMADNGMFMHGD